MKIRKNFIQKIIAEEMANQVKQLLIRAFIEARQTSDIKALIDKITSLGIKDPLTAIQHLKKDEVDTRFYINCVEMHNSMARELNKPEKSLNVDAFPKFPDTGMKYDRTPRGNKEIDSANLKLSDDRKDKKNLKGGISEEKNNIKSFILNNLRFKLEDNDELFNKELDSFYDNDGNHSELLDALRDLYNDGEISKKYAKKMFDLMRQYRSKKDDELMAQDPPPETQDYPEDEQDPNDKRSHLKVVKEKIIKLGLGPALRR